MKDSPSKNFDSSTQRVRGQPRFALLQSHFFPISALFLSDLCD